MQDNADFMLGDERLRISALLQRLVSAWISTADPAAHEHSSCCLTLLDQHSSAPLKMWESAKTPAGIQHLTGDAADQGEETPPSEQL